MRIKILKTAFTFLLIFSSLFSIAQTPIDKMSSEMKEVLKAADACYTLKSENCEKHYHQLLKLAVNEKYEYLDFIYYKLCLYHFRNFQQDSALYYAEKGLNDSKDQDSKLSLLNFKANILYDQGKTDSAIYAYINLADELESSDEAAKLAYTYANIGILMGSQKNEEKSLEYLLKSYKLLEEMKDTVLYTTITGNIALSYFYLDDYEHSKKWAFKTINIRSNNPEGKILSYNSLSKIYLKSNPDSALYYSRKAVDLSRSVKHHQLAHSLQLLANAMMENNMSLQAEKTIEESVKVFKKIQNKPGLSDALFDAGKIYLNNKDYYNAANILLESRQLRDSLLSEERVKIVNDITTKYETEKKEKQLAKQALEIQKQRTNLLLAILGGTLFVVVLGGIIVYNKNAQKLKLKKLQQEKENAILNSFILGEERERKRISQELHDGVAAMIGAAKMSLESIPHLPQEKQKTQFSKIKAILESTHADVRYIAHNLLPTVLEKEGLVKATSHFACEINETQLVTISVIDNNSNAQELSPQLQLMLFRIIQELVNNIIKHSQAQNAQIIFNRNSTGLHIEISDDGIGYKTDENAGNQGLYSITKRLKSIGGNFKIMKKNHGGTQATVELSI